MAKVRVPVWGKAQGHVTVNTEATKGAVVGETLFNADGTLYMPPEATQPAGTTKTLWSLLVNLPAIVTSLVNLATDGFVRKSGSNLTASPIVNADLSGANTDGLAEAGNLYFTTDRAAQAAIAPTLVAATFTVPTGKQTLFALPIEVDGTLEVDGALVEVT